jgi:hypothetical protein
VGIKGDRVRCDRAQHPLLIFHPWAAAVYHRLAGVLSGLLRRIKSKARMPRKNT